MKFELIYIDENKGCTTEVNLSFPPYPQTLIRVEDQEFIVLQYEIILDDNGFDRYIIHCEKEL